ncbi:hypothetical protein ERUR111494_02505 [Erysipelothrix urinaevulpis]|uniref:hypothetical protein n=1 Tax=Erysipelothrix urinaevulpis TaxID=2683717 RepID=UPI00135CC15C|nr:hypothetical protein [Erysipelothrix urinaevulpis]
MQIIKETIEVYPSFYNMLVNIIVPLIVACVPIFVAIKTIKSELSRIEKTIENQNSIERLRYQYEVTRNKNDKLVSTYMDILFESNNLIDFTYSTIDYQEKIQNQKSLIMERVDNFNWDHSSSVDLRNVLDNITEEANIINRSKNESYSSLVVNYNSIRLFINFEKAKEVELDDKVKQYFELITAIFNIPAEDSSYCDKFKKIRQYHMNEINASKELSELINIILTERIKDLDK